MILLAIFIFSSFSHTQSLCPSFPYTPKNNFNYNPRYFIVKPISWDYVCDAWNLTQSNKITIGFTARGSSGFLGIFDEINTRKYKYAIFFGSEFQIFKGEKSKINTKYAAKSLMERNLSSLNEYFVVFDKNDSSITVVFNGEIALICKDDFSIENLKFISFSQIQDKFVIYQVQISSKIGLNFEKILNENFLEKNDKNQNIGDIIDFLSIFLFLGSIILIAIFKIMVSKFMGKA